MNRNHKMWLGGILLVPMAALAVAWNLAAASPGPAAEPGGPAVTSTPQPDAGRFGPAPAIALTSDPRVQAMMDQVQTEDLLYHLTALTGERVTTIGGEPYTILTRYSQKTPGGTEGVRKAAQYLLERYAEWGIQAEAWHYSTYDWVNVVAELPGWVHPERVHILCAHYDSRSENGTSSEGRAPGADDNGSGTVAVLLAADILRQHAFEDTIRFVHFSGEEVGIWGSSAYAHAVSWAGGRIVDVINLDMIAWDKKYGPDIDLHAKDPASQEVADAFASVIQAYGLNLIPQKIYGSLAIGLSDHAPFWDVGIPAFLAIEDYYPGHRDFNDHYHTVQDLVANLQPPECEHCLDYFTQFARATLGTVAHRAGLLPEGLPTPTPTATPTSTATPACPDQLPDGGFEAGLNSTAWTLDSPQGLPLISQEKPRTGTWGALLGNQTSSGDRIGQTVHLPAGATAAALSAWWYMETDEWQWGANPAGHPHDRLRVQVLNPAGVLLAELEVLTEMHPQGRWNFSTWDLAPYVGQTVQVRFAAETNFQNVTRFFLDDVALRYCTLETVTPTPTSTPTATATVTPTRPPVRHAYLPWVERGGGEMAR